MMNDTGPTWLTVGTDALDQVFGGGIREGSTVMFTGLPGAGKTTLAEQFMFANASPERRALYLSTYSEPLSKIVGYLKQFSFFDRDRMHSSVVYRDLGVQLRERGVAALPGALDELLDSDTGYAIVVIDSLKALHDLGGTTEAFRLAVFDIASRLGARGITSIWIGGYAADGIGQFPEFAVADGIVELRNTSHGVRSERSLRVLKMRGTAPLAGEHTFTIDASGIEVFPRLVDAAQVRRLEASADRLVSGVEGFDTLTGGGLWRGSSTLVLGPSGAGKTTLGLTFLAEGALRGDAGLLLTLQEAPQNLASVVEAFGPEHCEAFSERVTVMHESPIEVDLVEVALRLKEAIAKGQVRRLVIDAVADLRDAAIDPSRLRAILYGLLRYCAIEGVTVLVNAELSLSGDHRPEDIVITSMVDNIVLLEYDGGPGRDATVTIVKTRRSAHSRQPHCVQIDDQGFHVVTAKPPAYAGVKVV